MREYLFITNPHLSTNTQLKEAKELLEQVIDTRRALRKVHDVKIADQYDAAFKPLRAEIVRYEAEQARAKSGITVLLANHIAEFIGGDWSDYYDLSVKVLLVQQRKIG